MNCHSLFWNLISVRVTRSLIYTLLGNTVILESHNRAAGSACFSVLVGVKVTDTHAPEGLLSRRWQHSHANENKAALPRIWAQFEVQTNQSSILDLLCLLISPYIYQNTYSQNSWIHWHMKKEEVEVSQAKKDKRLCLRSPWLRLQTHSRGVCWISGESCSLFGQNWHNTAMFIRQGTAAWWLWHTCYCAELEKLSKQKLMKLVILATSRCVSPKLKAAF